MYAHGLRVTTAGYNAMILRRGLQLAAKAVSEFLEQSAVEVSGREQLEWVGAISAADPEIGRLVADLFDKLGKDAGVNVEDGRPPRPKSTIWTELHSTVVSFLRISRVAKVRVKPASTSLTYSSPIKNSPPRATLCR